MSLVVRILLQKAVLHCEGIADILGVKSFTSLPYYSVAQALVALLPKGRKEVGWNLEISLTLMMMFIIHFLHITLYFSKL